VPWPHLADHTPVLHDPLGTHERHVGALHGHGHGRLVDDGHRDAGLHEALRELQARPAGLRVCDDNLKQPLHVHGGVQEEVEHHTGEACGEHNVPVPQERAPKLGDLRPRARRVVAEELAAAEDPLLALLVLGVLQGRAGDEAHE